MMSIPARSMSPIASRVASSWARFEPRLGGHSPHLLGAHPHGPLMGQLVAID
jgi:hypothetical protein